VRANILKHQTPLNIRRAVSGADQNREAVVQKVKISRVIEVFLSLFPAESEKPVYDAIKDAITVTGFRRPATSRQLTDDWSGVSQFAVHSGNRAVAALQKLESFGLAQSTTSLRSLKKLMLPSARVAMAEKMLTCIKTQQQFESVVSQLQHEQLVDIHWRHGNPHIAAEKKCVSVIVLARVHRAP
jgi:hypothetical protein